MKPIIGIGIAVAALAGAQIVRSEANDLRPPALADEPYAPSPDAARIVSLGYNELAADLLTVRLVGYFGGTESTGNGIVALVESIVVLDPQLRWVYEWGARAASMARHAVDNAVLLRVTAVLERGAKEFPNDYKLLQLAGQIYTQDLVTDDPAQRRRWDEKGTLLVEAAIRRPGAPASIAVWASVMRSKFGQHERAINELREMFLLTNDTGARKQILDRLATLVGGDQDELAAEVQAEGKAFERRWEAERPALPPTMYILLGPTDRSRGVFDLTDLATGGRDIINSPPVETLPPLED
ncbi:MAG: hypothetical protein NT062_03130 [Proteobacteria bacterium]|nr:hypothetical protein [Pseudomonadota bacterium]